MMPEETIDENEYPNWIYKSLIEDDLPWEDTSNINFIEFDKTYSLHDSHWLGIFYNIAYEQSATLAILWDEFWLPDRVKEKIAPDYNRIFLFVKLMVVEQISTNNFDSSYELYQKCISTCDIEIIDDRKFLAIDDVVGGQVNIIYSGREKFLAIDSKRRVLTI